jgi:hypothetical protein
MFQRPYWDEFADENLTKGTFRQSNWGKFSGKNLTLRRHIATIKLGQFSGENSALQRIIKSTSRQPNWGNLSDENFQTGTIFAERSLSAEKKNQVRTQRATDDRSEEYLKNVQTHLKE